MISLMDYLGHKQKEMELEFANKPEWAKTALRRQLQMGVPSQIAVKVVGKMEKKRKRRPCQK